MEARESKEANAVKMERIPAWTENKSEKMDKEKERCVRCGSKFRDRCDLEEHIRRDHKCRCNWCDEEFKLCDQLVKHMGMKGVSEFEWMGCRKKCSWKEKGDEKVKEVQENKEYEKGSFRQSGK